MTQATTLDKKQVATLLKFGYNYKQIASLYSLPKKEIKQLAKSEWNLRCPSKAERLATHLEIQYALDKGKRFSDIASSYDTPTFVVQNFYHTTKNLLPKELATPHQPERSDFLGVTPFNDFTSLYFTPAGNEGKILIYTEGRRGDKRPLMWVDTEVELNVLRYACEGLQTIEEESYETVWSQDEDEPCKNIFPRYYESCTLPKELHPWLLPITGIYPYFLKWDEETDTACLAVVVKEKNCFSLVPLMTLMRVGYSVGGRGEIIVPEGTEPSENELGFDADGWPMGLRFAFPSGISEKRVSKWLPKKNLTDPANGENHP